MTHPLILNAYATVGDADGTMKIYKLPECPRNVQTFGILLKSFIVAKKTKELLKVYFHEAFREKVDMGCLNVVCNHLRSTNNIEVMDLVFEKTVKLLFSDRFTFICLSLKWG